MNLAAVQKQSYIQRLSLNLGLVTTEEEPWAVDSPVQLQSQLKQKVAGAKQCCKELYASIGTDSGLPAWLWGEPKHASVHWKNWVGDTNTNVLLFRHSSVLVSCCKSAWIDFWNSFKIYLSFLQLSVLSWGGGLKRTFIIPPGRLAEVLQASSWSTPGPASGDSSV